MQKFAGDYDKYCEVVTHYAARTVQMWALRNEATLPHGLQCVWAGENKSRR